MGDPLSRPPVFGDIEQINAIKAIRQEEKDNEGKTKFKVDVWISHSESYDIWAEDKDEAEEIARDSIDLCDYDVDINVKKITPDAN